MSGINLNMNELTIYYNSYFDTVLRIYNEVWIYNNVQRIYYNVINLQLLQTTGNLAITYTGNLITITICCE